MRKHIGTSIGNDSSKSVRVFLHWRVPANVSYGIEFDKLSLTFLLEVLRRFDLRLLRGQVSNTSYRLYFYHC